jgi:short-subunit dehydrogenase
LCYFVDITTEYCTMPVNASSHTALVTGASGGIGRAIAEQFARAGINLVLSARSEATLHEIADDWQARYGVTVTVLTADLSEPGAAAALAEQVASAGIDIDYLVNNAGFGTFGLFTQTELDATLSLLRVNIEALTELTHRFLPNILARRGRILNVASTASFQPGPYMAVYCASKAYVLSFSEALAAELAGTGVTVTALCPGATLSGFQERAAMQSSGFLKRMRLATSESVAAAGYRAMMAGRAVFIPGLANRLMVFSVRFAPRSMVAALSKRILAPE